MSEQCQDTLRCDPSDLKQAMSIHTSKITDSCRDKDCIEDLRVYLTTSSQQTLDNAASARVRSAELLYTYIDVEPVAFDRNHYCIDVTFYYRILADAVVGVSRPVTLYGLAVFSKRAVLCGEDSRAHVYRSTTRIGDADGLSLVRANLPAAVVEVADTNSPNEKPAHIRHIKVYTLHNITLFSKQFYKIQKNRKSPHPVLISQNRVRASFIQSQRNSDLSTTASLISSLILIASMRDAYMIRLPN